MERRRARRPARRPGSATTGSGSYSTTMRSSGVLGDVAVARHDDADRLADVADAVDGRGVERRCRRRAPTGRAARARARRRRVSDAEHAVARSSAPDDVERRDAGVRGRSSAGSRRAPVLRQRVEVVHEPAAARAAAPRPRRAGAARPTHGSGRGGATGGRRRRARHRSEMINRCRLAEPGAPASGQSVRVSWTRAAGRNAERPLERRPGPAPARRAGGARPARRDGAREPPRHARRPRRSAWRARCRRAATSSRTPTRRTAWARAA